MHSIRAVLLATLTVCGFAVAVPTAAAPTPTTPADVSPTTLQTGQNATTTNATLGAEISSFMQVSTSQAKGTVETGLWVARYNGTKNESARQTLVEGEVDELEDELEDVRQRKQSLVEARKNGEISTLQYQARMSEVVGEIRSLEHAINATKPRAQKVGVRGNKLQQLDEQASTVGGPEVAAVARSLRSVNAPNENATNATTSGVGNGSIGNAVNGTTPENGDVANESIDNEISNDGVGGNLSVGIGNGKNDGNAGGNGSSPSGGSSLALFQ